MKSVYLLFVFILVQSTFANEYINGLKKLSWAELDAHYDVAFEGHQVWFGGRIFSRLDLCIENEQLRTKTKVKIEEYDGDDFYVVGYDYLYRSLKYTRVIVDGDATRDEVAYHQITKFISVVQNDDDFEGDLLFKKSHTFKNCQ